MSKTYQKKTAAPSRDVPVPPLEAATVVLAEIAESAREGLLALAVATGLQVMDTWMNADVEALCGPRGKHNSDRAGYRHGVEAGSVTLGGRRVPLSRPRVRAA
ncbi:MAG: IS256 family transposase, partial [Actinomycetota bacterium]|nr:IS256 family transposase [Actinomycetota bacterium]